MVTQTPHYTRLLDATKYSDRFDWDMTWHVALHMGFPVAPIVMGQQISPVLLKLRSISVLSALQPIVLVKVSRLPCC